MKEARPIRCLVIQLTRLGDNLQSLMALRAAKQLYPQLEIHFVAREQFAEAAKRVPWIDQVITFPSDRILGSVTHDEADRPQTLSRLTEWVLPLTEEIWEIAINWSYSESSSFLTGMIPAKIKLGYSRRPDATFSCSDGWSHYIQAVVQGGIKQNIHLTDILTTQLLTALQIHYGDPENDGNAPVTSKTFFQLELNESSLAWCWKDLSRKWIGIQLGAGREVKTWSPENWARVAAYILRRHPECSIVALGEESDLHREEAFLCELGRQNYKTKNILSLVGKTDFDLWATMVSRCQWILSCDTAVIHLASVLGTRIVNLSLGPVRFLETGPYGNGHYVIAPLGTCMGCEEMRASPESHHCQSRISPEAVYSTWAYASSEWAHQRHTSLRSHFSRLGWSTHLETTRIFRTRIRSTDDGGGVFYESLSPHPLELSDWVSMVMGHIARAWYCGWVPAVGRELSRSQINPNLVQRLRELQEATDILSKIWDEAGRTASLLSQKSTTLRSDKIMPLKDREELAFFSQKLNELDSLAERLGKNQAPLLAFAQMSRVLMHNLKEKQLAGMGRECAECYRQLNEGLAIFKEWIRYTLSLAKPVALEPTRIAIVPRIENRSPSLEPSPEPNPEIDA